MKHFQEDGHRSAKNQINLLLLLWLSAFPLFKRKPMKLLSLHYDLELQVEIQVDRILKTIFNQPLTVHTQKCAAASWHD